MKRDGIPITRENYLHIAYFGDVPDPWGAELEAELPPQLPDWSQFERTGPLPPERRQASAPHLTPGALFAARPYQTSAAPVASVPVSLRLQHAATRTTVTIARNGRPECGRCCWSSNAMAIRCLPASA
jgi:hypothetical protein